MYKRQQRADLAEHVVAAEEVAGQIVARLADGHVLMAQQLIQHSRRRVERLLGLGEVADVEAGPQRQLAGQRFQLAKDDFEEGGLARTVGADEGRRCLLYTSPSPRDRTRSRMPSSA